MEIAQGELTEITTLRKELQEYQALCKQQNDNIGMLVQEISQTKIEMQQSETEIMNRVGSLLALLNESDERSQDLLGKIRQYEELVKVMGSKI